MSREEKARIDCLVEDRGALVDAVAFLFNEDRKKVSKMNSLKLVTKLERAHLGCDEIIDDLIEDGFDIVSLPNDYGELLMIYYGAALRFSVRKVNVKKEKKASTKGKKNSVGDDSVISILVEKNPKKEGTKAHTRFALYREGMAVREYIEAGGTRGDVNWDLKRNYIAVTSNK
jgi:hypothetical protein